MKSHPISNDSSNFNTSRVTISDKDILKIKPSLVVIVLSFTLFIFLNGIFAYMIYGGIMLLLKTDNKLVGFAFFLGGALLLWLFGRLKLFSHGVVEIDRETGSYRLCSFWLSNRIVESGGLSDISMVQILKKIVKAHNGTRSVEFISYEVNLCRDDSSRINLLDHGVEDVIVADANQIARYIGVPVVRANT